MSDLISTALIHVCETSHNKNDGLRYIVNFYGLGLIQREFPKTGSPEETADILQCHHWFPCELTLGYSAFQVTGIIELGNSILMTCHYPDLGSASDRSCHEGNLLQPIRSTNQVLAVTHH